jgi:hypothetical protein
MYLSPGFYGFLGLPFTCTSPDLFHRQYPGLTKVLSKDLSGQRSRV